jgi:hypothetical protein
MTLRNIRQLSGNPNDELQGNLGETEMKSGMDELTQHHYKWSIQDEAIHRGNNYADANDDIMVDLMRTDGMSFHAVLKNAYQEGFLHGFEHKFDNTNYEEKE